MSLEQKPFLRLAGASVLAVSLVATGALIGARIWPSVVMIEQRVVAPTNGVAIPANRADEIADLVDRVCPAIVAITQSSSRDPSPPQSGPASGNELVAATQNLRGEPASMTGFLISADGYLLASVSSLSGQTPVRVSLNDGRSFNATRAGQDPSSGLALLKIDATGLPFLQFAASHFPRVGDRGIALASPSGTGCLAEAGMISVDFVAEQASLASYIRVRPALEPSFAGMPFLNLEGQVVGVSTGAPQAIETSAGTPLLAAGTAARITSALLRNETPSANRFGIIADDLLPELAARLGADRQRGAVISLIRTGSPAALAGLKAGDVILSVSSMPISGASELTRALDTNDHRVPLTILRRTRRITIIVEAR